MKRFTENDTGESEYVDLKEVRFLDESSGDLEKIGVGEGDVIIENGEMDSDIKVQRFNLGGQEEKKGFDLNFPGFGTDGGWMENSFQEHTQEGPAANENRVEINRYPSDDTDHELEKVGNFSGDKGKDKQIDAGFSYDRQENLNIGLTRIVMEDGVGGNNSVTGCGKRYTREEKRKANIDELLSGKVNCLVDLDLRHDSEKSFGVSEPIENVEVRKSQPVPLPLLERFDEKHRQILNVIENDKQLAGIIVNKSSGQDMPPAFKDVKQLENQDKFITQSLVPLLLDLSLKVLAENAEAIVSLELVPYKLRKRLTDMLCDMKKIDAHIMNLLVKGSPTEIRIKNCSWLAKEQLQQTFENCQTKLLRVLQLDLCGQYMLDYAFMGLLTRSSNSFSSLAILSLRGACRLSDAGLKALVMSAPTLRSINLGQCPLLSCDAITFIAYSLGSILLELYIDDCQNIDVMLILHAFKKFEYLEVLSVAGMPAVTDQFISEMIFVCGQSMKELDLAGCLALTDDSLKVIGSSCADLRSLNISNLHNLTDLGMKYLENGCRSIQNLKLCRNGFSDEAVAAFLTNSGSFLVELSLNSVKKVGPHTAASLATCSRNLMSLDISWCRKITGEALRLIVDSHLSLKLVKIFGCKQIKPAVLNGHSNSLVQIIGWKFSPLLENLNLLEPDEVFLRYSCLPIC